ncbi:MAG: antibiotic biosynthesis monooxygenase family protein [Pseudomonadota bacterium]
MYVVANRVPVAAAWREEFERRFRERAGQIDAQPGFLRMEILKPADDKSPYVVLTAWRDAEAFGAWVGSEDFKAAHRNPMPKEAFEGESSMERHDVIISAVGRDSAD